MDVVEACRERVRISKGMGPLKRASVKPIDEDNNNSDNSDNSDSEEVCAFTSSCNIPIIHLISFQHIQRSNKKKGYKKSKMSKMSKMSKKHLVADSSDSELHDKVRFHSIALYTALSALLHSLALHAVTHLSHRQEHQHRFGH